MPGPRRVARLFNAERFRKEGVDELLRRKREIGTDKAHSFREKALALSEIDDKIKTRTEGLRDRSRDRANALRYSGIVSLKKRIYEIDRQLREGSLNESERDLKKKEKGLIELELEKAKIQAGASSGILTRKQIEVIKKNLDILRKRKKKLAADLIREYGLENMEGAEHILGED